jgi:hypothetical protein
MHFYLKKDNENTWERIHENEEKEILLSPNFKYGVQFCEGGNLSDNSAHLVLVKLNKKFKVSSRKALIDVKYRKVLQ